MVDAPPETVFAWLCQMRVAPYSYDRLDNWGREALGGEIRRLRSSRSARRSCWDLFQAEVHRYARQITLRHQGVFGEVAVAYAANPGRLVAKLRCRYPGGPARRVVGALLPAGDLVMMRKQLR